MTDKPPAMPELPDGATVLPDGSAFAIASFPLPSDHWLYAPREYRDGEEEPIELPSPILSHQAHGDVVRAAIRYAVRGATMCGKEPDFDPDALVQNAMYALCGPFGGATLQSAQPAAAVAHEAERLLLQEFLVAYDSPLPSFDAEGWAERARASLPAPQQATPAEEFKTINCQVNGIDGTAEVRRVDENTVDIGRVVAFAQATPEPVGEPVACREKLTGRLCEPEDTHRRKFPMCYEPLFTHPAPGVPEGFALVPMTNAEVFNLRAKLRQEGVGLNVSVPQLKCVVEAVEDRLNAMLAAAQAKGGQA